MDFAEQVKAQVDIVRTVREYVPNLRRAGTRWVGLCPFHTEKTPSFGVTPSLGIYKCFGCGAGGDVIHFVQQIEQLTFWEALKSLAERNGIPIPQRRERPDPDTELRAAIFDMHETAVRIFHENLFGGPGAETREYLTRRGVSAASAQQFQLGYSEPAWDTLAKRFAGKYSAEQMEKSGLFGRREDGGFYDRFRGRLMFPIHNESGKTIAFGGRALRPDDEPKYLNSPETSIYRKKTVLYNLHRAKEGARKSNRTVLVEGYMDVIGVYAAGVKNVVATCGTALTSEQVRSVKRYSENISVNFDPDTAGVNATERSLQILIDEGMHVRVLELEAGLDPDEFIRKYGAEAYQSRLDRASGYFLWLADRARKKFGAASAESRMAGYQEILLPAIRRISHHLERAAVATEVADYLGLDRNLVLGEFRRMPGQRSSRPNAAAPEPAPLQERILLRSILLDRQVRDALLPRLQVSAAARHYRIWRILEEIFAIYQADAELSYETVQARAGDDADLLTFTLMRDSSDEVMTADQAVAFTRILEAEDAALQVNELKRRIQTAEKSGNLEEALQLAAELKRRSGRNSSG
jgi:DNA primase